LLLKTNSLLVTVYVWWKSGRTIDSIEKKKQL
jgi:hypothetical protein